MTFEAKSRLRYREPNQGTTHLLEILSLPANEIYLILSDVRNTCAPFPGRLVSGDRLPPPHCRKTRASLQKPRAGLQKPPANVKKPPKNAQKPISTLQNPLANMQKTSTRLQKPTDILQNPIFSFQEALALHFLGKIRRFMATGRWY